LLLKTQIHTPSPPKDQQQQQAWVAQTLHNINQLHLQTDLLKQYLKRRTQSPPLPAEVALNQLVKSCQLAVHSAVLLAHKNERLQQENKHQKKKTGKKRSYIAKSVILTVAEAEGLINTEQNVDNNSVENEAPQAWQRAPPKCSICASPEHNTRTCPRRQTTASNINKHYKSGGGCNLCVFERYG
jgi:hypothetical protein